MATATTARRFFGLIEPIALVPYSEPEPTDELLALGLGGMWDAYFAGRAAPLGRDVPAEVVDALFFNFAPGEVARHIPGVWETVTPEAVIAARERGAVAALRRCLGDLADGDGIGRAGDLLLRAGTSVPVHGRGLYAAVRTIPIPSDPVARLWHGANLLREHRGDGHVAALVAHGIGGTEAHVLHALSEGMQAEEFGRVSHLPPAQLAAVVDGMAARGLVDDGRLSEAGHDVKRRVEALTDELAAPAYATLDPTERDDLIALLDPLAAALTA